MAYVSNDDYSHPTFRAEGVHEALGNCSWHSRQSEITIYDALWPLPKRIIEFFTAKVSVQWKRKNHVALLLESAPKKPYLIVLDTKLENESRPVRIGIVCLKIAEAYILENPSIKMTREELATEWGIDLSVLQNESISGLTY
jgi:hypothetical protein